MEALKDALIGIFEWILELLRTPLITGIKAMMSYIFGSISGGLTDIQGLLADTPQSYNATIYGIVSDTSETIILPIAMSILVIISVYELVMNVANTSNMKEFDIMGVIKWLLKFLFSLFVLANTFRFAEWIFSIGPIIANMMLGSNSVISDVTDTAAIVSGIETIAENMSIWEVIGFTLVTAIIAASMLITQIILTTYMLFRFMEIYLTLSLAPIPMATFGSKEYSRMGESFIKTILSYALQVFLIILAIAIYTSMINVTITEMITSGVYNGMATIQLLAITIIMVMMITKTKSLAREVLN